MKSSLHYFLVGNYEQVTLPSLCLGFLVCESEELENQPLQVVVKLNEKTGLAHRNCELCVSRIIIVGGDDAVVLI